MGGVNQMIRNPKGKTGTARPNSASAYKTDFANSNPSFALALAETVFQNHLVSHQP
jgi:hypothetical protein